jgi:hypothetical protein
MTKRSEEYEAAISGSFLTAHFVFLTVWVVVLLGASTSLIAVIGPAVPKVLWKAANHWSEAWLDFAMLVLAFACLFVLLSLVFLSVLVASREMKLFGAVIAFRDGSWELRRGARTDRIRTIEIDRNGIALVLEQAGGDSRRFISSRYSHFRPSIA